MSYVTKPKNCTREAKDCRITVTPKFAKLAVPPATPVYDGTGALVSEDLSRHHLQLSCLTCGLEWTEEAPRMETPRPTPPGAGGPPLPEPPKPVMPRGA